MARYAVAYINFFDNNIILEIVKAKSWKEALFKHSSFINHKEEMFDTISDDIEEAKTDAFDQEWLFDVKEIKSNKEK